VPKGEVVVTGVVALAPNEAFAAFTDQIDRWWRRPPGSARDEKVEFDGRRLVAVSPARVDVLATVTEWDPPTRLRMDWNGPHGEPGDTVAVEFEPDGHRTRITIRHRRRGLEPQAVESAIVGLWWGDLLARVTA
jgi:hypothetical protein